MNLGVLGTFVWDTVWTQEDQAAGRPREAWGGVAYAMASAAAAKGSSWKVAPIAKVGADLWDEVHGFLDTLGGAIGPRGGMLPVEVPNNRVELRYLDAHRRDETLTGGVPGWEWSELEPRLQGIDALYVNFLSGNELPLETARRLAREFHGPLYTDLHSLFLGPASNGPRRYRPLPDWEQWLACFDVVQLNEDERAMLGVPHARLDPPRELTVHGPQVVLVTLGPDGALCASHPCPDQRGGPRSAWRGSGGADALVPAWRTVQGGDPTGCGDVWGAAVFTGLTAGLELRRAMERAHRLAAVKMEHRGAGGLYEHLTARRDEWNRGMVP